MKNRPRRNQREPAIAYAFVTSANMKKDPKLKMQSHSGIASVEPGEKPGEVMVEFEADHFSTTPAVNVTPIYNGNANYVPRPVDGSAPPEDGLFSAGITFVNEREARILLGEAYKSGYYWVAFSITAIGPPGSSKRKTNGRRIIGSLRRKF